MARTKTVTGRVTLVGAGPGDPELLTIKAARVLAEADVVFYDALVPDGVLALASGLLISVGKRAGKHSVPQDETIRLMIRAARAGKRVVRLKGGDPYVFGRGGEERLALEAEGIPVEVVQGVTSAIAAPAAIGVPVTHRGLSSGFVVLTAQPDRTWRSVVARLEPSSVTLVFMMALASRVQIARALRASAWPPETPVAIVLGATHAGEWSWAGTLAELEQVDIPHSAADLPGTLIVGEVVRLAKTDTSVAAFPLGGAA